MSKRLRLRLLIASALLSSGIAPAQQLAPGVTRVPVTLSGGHETLGVDRGRPVILIAAALGVTPEVFRDAFSHVRPAGPGSGGPTDAEARQNKAALMNALGKFGITNERLDTVSNYYRYPPGRGGLWKTQETAVNALIKNGVIIGYEIVKGGSGYSSSPTLTVPGHPAAAPTVLIAYGKDLDTNGRISVVSLPAPKTK